MDLAGLQTFLGWCIVFNYGLLFLWFIGLKLTGDWVFRLQGRLFGLDPDSVRTEHFHMMGQFKLIVMVFNIAPWLALLVMTP